MACNLRKSYNILAFNSFAERIWRKWQRNISLKSGGWDRNDSTQSKLCNEKTFTEVKLMINSILVEKAKACSDCKLSLTDS